MEKVARTLITVGALACLILGQWLTLGVFKRPLTNDELKHYRQIAQQVYDNSDGSILAVVPDEVKVEITSEKIVVKPSSGHAGGVEAKLMSGILVFEDDDGFVSSTWLGMLIGIMCMLVYLTVSFVAYAIYCKNKAHNQNKN